jgi:hypothetical protein
MSDPVNAPDHYVGRGGIEPLEFIMSNNLGFCEGNVIKYVFRYDKKDGLKDLLKARVYLNRLIAREEKKSEQGK